MFDDIFIHKKIVPERLLSYGFKEDGKRFLYTADILNGEFSLTVCLSENGAIDTDLLEKETDEPYTLYKTNAVGTFVGEIRSAVERVLTDIAERCCETAVFKSDQAQMLIEYVRSKYGDELEFLWTKFPNNAVWRRKDNSKWYGAILTVIGSKIGLDTGNTVEIVDLRMDKNETKAVLSRENYYHGWHMNKNT